jgi:hypothetical protein
MEIGYTGVAICIKWLGAQKLARKRDPRTISADERRFELATPRNRIRPPYLKAMIVV